MSSSERPWVDGLTFEQVLAKTTERFGERDALVFPQLKYRRTYSDFQQDVRETATALLALGVQRGEHVGIWATNWPQWIVLQFAVAHVGAVLVNINPAYRAGELEYVLNQADVSTLFLTDQFKTSNYFEILKSVCPASPIGELTSEKCPKLRRAVSIKATRQPGIWSWDEFRALAKRVPEAELTWRQAEVKPEDVVNIQYTSGTTGFPKGAMLTHRNLLLNAFYTAQRQRFTDRDRLCIPVPFYHCFGCVLGTLACAITGTAMIVPAEFFDPLATLQAIQNERCTALYGVPTMFIAQLNHPRFREFNVKSLRTGVMAGSPCPIEVMRQVIDEMGAKEVTIGYGLTEASPLITQSLPTDDLEHRISTVGVPLPGLEVKVVAPGSLNALPPGEQGELIVRGHGVMKGYYHKPKETEEAITTDRWLHSGDLAVRTPDGYYRITGRIKEMICRGGEKVFPREVEEFLYTHPAVADAYVVGLPDEHFGEEVSAWIRLKAGTKATEDEIKTFCRERIAHFKAPRYVVFVDEFPTTVTGKIQKFKLRELGVERFGLHKAAEVKTA